ncbi:hypothetical protein [Microtetraspora malaysiensis]|uniref:Phage portal protein n=1 Tax=Microtetraspora malaysiensis TaxID=161358 RepID=A0ABW6SKH2_9ACTN
MSARTLVAAAARWTARRFGFQVSAPDQTWQRQAWAYYDSTPEVRFAATWIGNAMSKGRLFAGRRAEDGTVDLLPPEHRASQLVASIAGGPAGQSQILGGFGPHLVVSGEGWIVIRPKNGPDGQPACEDWRVLSVMEMSRKGDSLEAEIDGRLVAIPSYDPATQDALAPVAIRVWAPHPRRHIEADSPIRSSLQLLEELRLLNAAVAAIARSRLTGRGILFVPQGTRFPTSATPGSEGEDDFLEVLMTVAETAYKDPESAAAAVPIILEVPADTIGKFQRITFESDFDDLAARLREETIRRFATGLDTPAEILLGQGSINHWGQWQLQSEAIQLAIEPRLATVADALTIQWLRPLLEAENHQDAADVLVWYDTSQLRVRVNRSQTALEVYDRGVITPEALRRETGFDETDAPEPGEERPARRDQQQAEDGEVPAAPELPVEESPRAPDTLPAAAALHDPAETLAWMDRRGRELGEQLKAEHGLDDGQLHDLLYAMLLTRAGGRDS